MELQTNPHNPRTISKDAYEKLKRSIERNPDGLTANKIAYKDGIIIVNIVKQSSEIAQGVDVGGAGDQGIMIGYACDENEDYVPNGIIEYLNLRQPIYEATASYGHFGRGFAWDTVETI